MTLVSETVVTLRFGGDDLDPDEISRLLGQQPDLAYRKGDVSLVGPRKMQIVRKYGMWGRGVPRAMPGDLDCQIAALLAPLTSDLGVWRGLSQLYRGDVFCGLFLKESNEGISLSATTLEAIGVRGLLLDLDIYGPLSEEEP